jgi:hypothetical protein
VSSSPVTSHLLERHRKSALSLAMGSPTEVRIDREMLMRTSRRQSRLAAHAGHAAIVAAMNERMRRQSGEKKDEKLKDRREKQWPKRGGTGGVPRVCKDAGPRRG